MIKTSKRHTMKMTVRAMTLDVAVPPCTASMLNTRISVPAKTHELILLNV